MVVITAILVIIGIIGVVLLSDTIKQGKIERYEIQGLIYDLDRKMYTNFNELKDSYKVGVRDLEDTNILLTALKNQIRSETKDIIYKIMDYDMENKSYLFYSKLRRNQLIECHTIGKRMEQLLKEYDFNGNLSQSEE